MSPAAGQYALPVFPSTRRPPVGFVLFAKSGKQLLQRIAAALPWPLDNFDDECAVLDRHFRALALGRTDLFGKCARHSQRKAVAPSHKFSSHHPLRRGAKYLQRISVRYADGNENQYPVARIQRQGRLQRQWQRKRAAQRLRSSSGLARINRDGEPSDCVATARAADAAEQPRLANASVEQNCPKI